MAGQGQGQQAQVEQQQEQHEVRISCPLFKGDTNDVAALAVQGRKFLSDFKAYLAHNALQDDDEVIRTIFARCFPTGTPAQQWWSALEGDPAKQNEPWTEIQTAFKERFAPQETLLQLVRQRETLTKRQGETVQAFNDRARLHQHAVDRTFDQGIDELLRQWVTAEHVPTAATRAAMRANFKKGILLLHNNTCGAMSFLGGLPTNLKEKVLAETQMDTREAIVQAAKRHEAASLEARGTNMVANLATTSHGPGYRQLSPPRGGSRPAWFDQQMWPQACGRCGNPTPGPRHTTNSCTVPQHYYRWNNLIQRIQAKQGGHQQRGRGRGGFRRGRGRGGAQRPQHNALQQQQQQQQQPQQPPQPPPAQQQQPQMEWPPLPQMDPSRQMTPQFFPVVPQPGTGGSDTASLHNLQIQESAMPAFEGSYQDFVRR